MHQIIEQMNSTSSITSHIITLCSKIADIVVLGLLVIFFVGGYLLYVDLKGAKYILKG